MSRAQLVKNLIRWTQEQKGPRLSAAYVDRFAKQVLDETAALTVETGRCRVPELGTFRVEAYPARDFTDHLHGGRVIHREAGQKIRFKPSPSFRAAAQTGKLYTFPKKDA